jgi:hypothetical protein
VTEQIYRDVFGDEIILTETVWSTILQKHPEVSDFIDQLDVVLAEPDEVRHSKRDDRSILYYRYEAIILNGKWVVVVVKQIDRNFISTIYATDQIKSGEVIWKKTS